MFIKCFTHIMVAMATYFPQNFCEKWKFFKSIAQFLYYYF
jgi:hypothetical protein